MAPTPNRYPCGCTTPASRCSGCKPSTRPIGSSRCSCLAHVAEPSGSPGPLGGQPRGGGPGPLGGAIARSAEGAPERMTIWEFLGQSLNEHGLVLSDGGA